VSPGSSHEALVSVMKCLKESGDPWHGISYLRFTGNWMIMINVKIRMIMTITMTITVTITITVMMIMM
jgi:hypothetical protein